MSDRSFLDTNVWLYAATGKASHPAKHAAARDLIATAVFAVSGQLIGEFVVNASNPKKMRTPLTRAEIAKWLEIMDEFEFIEIDKQIVQSALLGVEKHNIRYWDSALLAQAERFGASTFYSEDLNDGQLYGSVRVLNPFRSA
jgi:predicted nucleic acid-binding protein